MSKLFGSLPKMSPATSFTTSSDDFAPASAERDCKESKSEIRNPHKGLRIDAQENSFGKFFKNDYYYILSMILLYTRFTDVIIIGLGVEFWERKRACTVFRGKRQCCAAWVREKNRAVERS